MIGAIVGQVLSKVLFAASIGGEAAGIGVDAYFTDAQLKAPNGDAMVQAGAGEYGDPFATANSGDTSRKARSSTSNPGAILLLMLCMVCCFSCCSLSSLALAM